jgi:hypothetical protein
MRVLKIFIASLFSLLILSGVKVYADCQCPSDIPPTGESWTSQGPVYITLYDKDGDDCRFKVYYCWRQFSPMGPWPYDDVVEIWVCDYSQTEKCHEDFDMEIWKIYKKLGEYIMMYNPDNLDWDYPPCNDPAYPNFVTIQFTCWDDYKNPCGSVYCKYSYWVRTCSGNPVSTPLDHEVVGGNCPEGCSSHCD